MKTIIHIDQHKIAANVRHSANDPAIVVKDSDTVKHTHTAIIRDSAGIEVARVVYSPDIPLPSGATAWIETQLKVETL